MQNAARLSSVSMRRQVIRLAWPLTSVMLGETFMGLVDTKLVGNLGGVALAAVGLANAAVYLATISMLGLLRGVKVCTAHARGAPDPCLDEHYLKVGLLLGLGFGVVMGFFLYYAASLFTAIGMDPELIPPARGYLVARAYGMPGACGAWALMEYRQGLGEVKTSLVVGVGGNIANAFLAYGLIYGAWGLPALGIAGAGLGTAIAEWGQLVVLLIWITGGRPVGVIRHIESRTLRRALKAVMAVGAPTAMHSGLEYLAFASCTAILGTLGRVDMAAHQVAVVVNRVAYLPGLALGEVACILVSTALGRGELQVAKDAMRTTLNVAVVFMVACGIFLALMGQATASLFSTDPAIVRRTADVLLLAGVFQVIDAVNLVTRGALRGAHDARATALWGIAILWLTVPLVTYVLGSVAGWGVFGGWCSFVVQTCLCAVVYTWRWRRGPWQKATPNTMVGGGVWLPTH